jgi:hypothetical protein
MISCLFSPSSSPLMIKQRAPITDSYLARSFVSRGGAGGWLVVSRSAGYRPHPPVAESRVSRVESSSRAAAFDGIKTVTTFQCDAMHTQRISLSLSIWINIGNNARIHCFALPFLVLAWDAWTHNCQVFWFKFQLHTTSLSFAAVLHLFGLPHSICMPGWLTG